MNNKKALLLIDLQNDFCRNGALEVPDGDAVIPIANQLQDYFDLIIATKDCHPKGHMSFASSHPGHKIGDLILVHGLQQVLWPDHCVQESKGSDFHPELDTHRISKVIFKGTDKNIDSYSAFFDNEHKRSTGLENYLREQRVQTLYIMGLATDYCVKYSCLDAVQLGFTVFVIEDGCRGVELNPGDCVAAYKEMQREGIRVIQSSEINERYE